MTPAIWFRRRRCAPTPMSCAPIIALAETKFLNGGAHDVGRLARRHVFVSAVVNIGKEADAFEVVEAFGADEEDVTLYGSSLPDREVMIAEIISSPIRALKVRAKVGHGTIERIISADARANASPDEPCL